MPDFSQLSPNEHEHLRRTVERFSMACRTTPEKVDLEAFLPPRGQPHRALTLQRLIPADLRRRWKMGERPLLEDYVQKFPELGAVDQLPVLLLRDEYQVRQEFDDRPSYADYEQRFPGQWGEFTRLMQTTDEETGTLAAPRLESPEPASPEPATTLDKVPAPSDELPPAAGAGAIGEGAYRLTLVRVLGKGQYGQVWLARAPGDVPVAVKIIQFPRGHEMTQQELHSLELIKKLRHPFLLSVQAFWFEHEKLVITTDLADMTLEDRLQECQADGLPGIPRDELIAYLRDAADGIDFIHEHHVIHRDIKPANILLVERHARVGDFGVARLLEHQADVSLAPDTPLGTPLYMPPEAYDGKASERSDQFSLAVTYVELRRGTPPFGGQTLTEVVRQIRTQPPDLAGLEESEQRVLRKALAKNAQERYSSCREFVRELEWAKRKKLIRRIAVAFICLTVITTTAWLYVNAYRYEVHVDDVVKVSAGGEDTFSVRITKGWLLPECKLRFDPTPYGKFTHSPSEGSVIVEVVDPNAEPGDLAVTMHLEASNHRQERQLTLRIVGPLVVPPKGFVGKPLSQNTYYQETSDSPIYYRRIYKDVRYNDVEELRVEFCLVHGYRLSKPFYMMETKVWNKLFDAYAKHPDAQLDEDTEWRKGTRVGSDDTGVEGDQLDWPVFNVSVEEADRFAMWLGGNLPSAAQWDQAAGTEDGPPYDKRWTTGNTDDIAIGHRETPLPVGQAKYDVTKFGIRDMAGNGYEWTDDVYLSRAAKAKVREMTPTQRRQNPRVVTRGMSFDEEMPFGFEEDYSGGAWRYNDPDSFISFRVLVKTPDKSDKPPAQQIGELRE